MSAKVLLLRQTAKDSILQRAKSVSFAIPERFCNFAPNLAESGKMWTSEEICSTVVLCPAKYVAACTEANFLASDESKVVELRARARAQFNRSEKNTDGGKLLEEDITFVFEDNSITAALRKSKFKYWIARVNTVKGYTRTIGSLRYPAVLEMEGTDTSDTLTLRTKQEV